MKLTQLEYFCVAARYHNITKAAKELFVTQPSISNAIKALEEEFGVNLFFRNNNKLTLTPEGELFYRSAEELLAHADSVESEFHEIRKKVTPIRIGIPPMLGTIYLPELYLSLKENFPEVDFRLFEYGSIKACNLVLEENLISQLSMPNSLPLINVILALLILKICFSVFLQIILWQNKKPFFSPCLLMNHCFFLIQIPYR